MSPTQPRSVAECRSKELDELEGRRLYTEVSGCA